MNHYDRARSMTDLTGSVAGRVYWNSMAQIKKNNTKTILIDMWSILYIDIDPYVI